MQSAIIITQLILVTAILAFLTFHTRNEVNNTSMLASYNFEDSTAKGWQPNIPEHWRVIKYDDSFVYELTAPGQQGKVWAPTSWSVLTGYDMTSFTFSGQFLCNVDTSNQFRDLCVFFCYQDPTHFYYVHFSAKSDEVHNIIGLVNGADRIKINKEPPGESAARLTDQEWHKFKLTYDASTGDMLVFLDDMETPMLAASDTTLKHGLVGVGSFDDTGYFDDIKLLGTSIMFFNYHYNNFCLSRNGNFI